MKLKDKTYSLIKQRIMDGTYAPGEQLNEKSIIEELDISRTPFREAMSALVQEGLVELKGNHGLYVFQPTPKDLIDLFDVRYLLEPSVAMLASTRISQGQINELRRKMQEALASSETQQLLQVDEEFHETLLQLIENQYLVKMMRQLYATFSIRNTHLKRVMSLIPSTREHLDILDAIERRDPNASADATRQHLVEARKRASGLLF